MIWFRRFSSWASYRFWERSRFDRFREINDCCLILSWSAVWNSSDSESDISRPGCWGGCLFWAELSDCSIFCSLLTISWSIYLESASIRPMKSPSPSLSSDVSSLNRCLRSESPCPAVWKGLLELLLVSPFPTLSLFPLVWCWVLLIFRMRAFQIKMTVLV